MSDPIALASSAHITADELIAFSREVGATITPDDVFLARLSRQDRHIWIAISEDPWDGAELQDCAQALGTLPETIIILEVSRTHGSMELAAEFADKFARRWPAVVDTLRINTPVYSVDKFLELCKKGFDFG